MIGIHFAGPDVAMSKLRIAAALGVSRHPSAMKVQQDHERLRAHAKDHWAVRPIDQADVVVYANPYANDRHSAEVARLAESHGLPCLFFRANDDASPARPPYGTVYRTSIFASKQTPCEAAMPALVDDVLATPDVTLLARSERPVVGFCGYVDTALNRFYYAITARGQKARGLRLRKRCLDVLRSSDEVECDFIAREGYWAGRNMDPDAAADSAGSAREQFLENLFGTGYNLCLRGEGNYSFRLYETLAAGRIPLFLDTDCVLPFEDEIDYRKHFCWVDQRDLGRIAEILAQFHADHDDDAFRQLQLDNRRLWEAWLSPSAFYQRILERAIASGPRPEAGAP